MFGNKPFKPLDLSLRPIEPSFPKTDREYFSEFVEELVNLKVQRDGNLAKILEKIKAYYDTVTCGHQFFFDDRVYILLYI